MRNGTGTMKRGNPVHRLNCTRSGPGDLMTILIAIGELLADYRRSYLAHKLINPHWYKVFVSVQGRKRTLFFRCSMFTARWFPYGVVLPWELQGLGSKRPVRWPLRLLLLPPVSSAPQAVS